MHAYVSEKSLKRFWKSLSAAAKMSSLFDYTTGKVTIVPASFANGPEAVEMAANILVYR